jgi:hypothetical protein
VHVFCEPRVVFVFIYHRLDGLAQLILANGSPPEALIQRRREKSKRSALVLSLGSGELPALSLIRAAD